MSTLDRKTRLQRMKLLALSFLIAALALLVVSYINGRQGIWGWIGAFAEAATVGALADWFAVVALFRHPLGLPIPHTAIIPRNQKRIADNLARFVHEKFLDREVLLSKLDQWNPARQLGHYLQDPARLQSFSRQIQSWAASALRAIDAPEIEREVLALIRKQLGNWNASATAAQLMRLLTSGQYHQRLLNSALSKIGDWMGQETVREFITEKLITMARREFPKLIWVTDKLKYTDDLADALAKRLADAIITELQDVLNDPQHSLRQHYSAEALRLMDNLEHDRELQEKVHAFKSRVVESPDLHQYLTHLWHQVRDWLHQDLDKENSSTMRYFNDYAERFGQRLREDSTWQSAVNAQIRIAADYLANQLRDVAPKYIRQTVESWDSQYLVREIEYSVGRDLQFIRLNGTMIGGLIGVLLYAIFHLPWSQWFGA